MEDSRSTNRCAKQGRQKSQDVLRRSAVRPHESVVTALMRASSRSPRILAHVKSMVIPPTNQVDPVLNSAA